jgi:hypothetical protein
MSPLRCVGASGTLSRFSIDKASRFMAYTQSVATHRQATVVVLYPAPGLLIALALAFIPLQNPAIGLLRNWGSWLHIFAINWLAMASGMVHTRAVSEIQHHEYSTAAILSVATLAALPATGFYFTLSYFWRFPVPFYPVFAPWPFTASLVLAHAIVFHGGRLHTEVRTKLVLYVPSLLLQLSQLTVYPAFSAVFSVANDWQQILLVLFFPWFKYLLRRAIVRASRHLRDFAQETAFCGVEICAAMYQASIMQSTPSPIVTALIIGVDILLNFIHIARYLDRISTVPTIEILDRATRVLHTVCTPPIQDQELQQYASPTTAHAIRAVTRIGCRRSSASIQPVRKTPGDDKLALTHALEMLQAAESILLVEYLEVAVPIVNAFYLVVASHLPSAGYNFKLRSFHENPSDLWPAVVSVVTYTFLQSLTLMGMCVAMRIRYRLPALGLLAFVLETHAWSLQGKLVMWLVAILGATTIHHGMFHILNCTSSPER